MHSPSRPLMPFGAAGIGGAASVLIGAPWWLTAVSFGCLALGLIVAAIQAVFPQESADRLAWWRDRRGHQRLRRQAAARNKTRTRR
jgi:hypothetical protein